ncbi:EpsG family protein [Pedobacter suwonensis]|uniref:EpsG family protein n=1 Tax=Pedobacter suwonensis TaxID=332999 RepID=UPI0011A7AEC7|nr:EpsG family protein [Pedobacter suwonensis]
MIAFVYLYIYLVVNTFVASSVKLIQKRLFIITSIIILFFVGLRDVSVGTDTHTYVSFFKNSDFLYDGEKTDVAFEILARSIKFLSNSEYFFLFVTSLFGLFGILFLIYKLSENKMLSLLLYMIIGTSTIFFFYIFSMIRQSCAITLFIFAVYLLFEYRGIRAYSIESKKVAKKKYLYWGLFFYMVSIQIHGSCAFTIPFVIFAYMYDYKSKLSLYWFIIISFIIGSFKIFSISNFMNLIFFYFGGLASRDYSSYGEISFGEIEKVGIVNMYLIPFTLISIFILRCATLKQINIWYVKLFLMSVVLNNLFYDNLMWSRLVFYLSIFAIVAIPNILKGVKKTVKLSFYIVFFTYFCYKTISQFQAQMLPAATGNIIVPYKSWLNL